jgi:3-methyladenine DNA glycosylase AlkD
MDRNPQIIKELRRSLSKVASPDGGQGAKAYMRNQFDFFGVQTPVRRALTRDLMVQSKELTERELIDLCKELWAQREREFQYVACDLLVKNAKRLSPDFVKRDAKWFITNKSWWDTVDSVRKAIEIIVAANPDLEEVTDKWIKSSNIWLVRSALIHQLTLGTKTNSERLFRYCELQATEKEFFIAKGLGWALRSYSYTDPKAVTKFVKNHPDLTPLAKREGLKRINRRNEG